MRRRTDAGDRARIWAGVDIGKEHHRCVVIDGDGRRLLSRRVLNGPGRAPGEGVIALDDEIAELEAQIEARFREHRYAEVILSMPGMGRQATAVFLAATGGDMQLFGRADRLAGYAGLAPAPRDSGRVSGNLRRPSRFHHGLLNAMYLAALSSLNTCPASKAYYQRKRAEGKGHKQALPALARRRINVLRAMLRDGAFYQPMPPALTRA